MPACEKCWGDAYRRERDLGGSQAEHYHNLLAERQDNPCSVAEQIFGRNCVMLDVADIKEKTRDINRAIDVYRIPLEKEVERLKGVIIELQDALNHATDQQAVSDQQAAKEVAKGE